MIKVIFSVPMRREESRRASASPTSILGSTLIIRSLIWIAERVIVDKILKQLASDSTSGAEGRVVSVEVGLCSYVVCIFKTQLLHFGQIMTQWKS